jgi:fluoride exporter
MMISWRDLMLVTAGSAAGGAARALLVSWTATRFQVTLPLGVLLVNVIGSFVFGIAVRYGVQSGELSDTARLLITTGLCGGFTTFSAFSFDIVDALEKNRFGLSAIYIIASLVFGVLAMWAGMEVGRGLAK